MTVNLANYWAAKGWDVMIVTFAPAEQDAYALDPSIARFSLSLEGANRNIVGALLQNFHRVMALRRVLLMSGRTLPWR